MIVKYVTASAPVRVTEKRDGSESRRRLFLEKGAVLVYMTLDRADDSSQKAPYL